MADSVKPGNFKGVYLALAWMACAASAQTPLSHRIFPELLNLSEDCFQDTEALSNALFAIERAEEDLVVRRSGRLPNLSSFGQYHYQREEYDLPMGEQDSGRFIYGLTLRQPLYHWGSLQANHNIGRILLQDAGRNKRVLQEILRSHLQRRALGYYIACREHDFAVLNLRHYGKMLELAEEGMAAGDVQSSELEAARQNFRNATKHQIAVLTAKLDVQYQLIKEFAVTDEHLGMIPEALPADIGIDLETWELRFHQFSTTGFKQHPEYLAVLSNLKVQEESVKVAKAGNRPLVDLVVGANQDDTTYTFSELDDRFRQIYFAGVRVSWNIFDGQATKARVNTAKANLRETEARKKFVARKLAQDANQVFHELQNSDARLRALRETVEEKTAKHGKVKSAHESGQVPDSQLANSFFDLAAHEHLLLVEYARSISHLLHAEHLTSLTAAPMELPDEK
jgi:outer membrane protein TolC